jgi:hypothetical protein
MEMLNRDSNFIKPQAEHGACPFWFWNGDLEPRELVRQIRSMSEQGIGGFIIHSRMGRTIEYLSETWFDRCQLAIEEAARLGMKVWIYDEDNWPSGYAGGRVLAADPTLTAQHLSIERHYFEGDARIRIEVASASEVVAVLGATVAQVKEIPRHPLAANPARPGGSWMDPNSFEHQYADEPAAVLKVRQGQVQWDAPPGRSCVMIYRRKPTCFHPTYSESGYVDLLNPAATKRFIQLTHEAYARRLGAHFGKTILGFFTDEPGFYNNFLNHNPGTLPWTGALLEQFHKRRGYDLIPWLGALWEQTGGHRVRADYWRTVAELFEEAFTGQLAHWCEAHGVALTGHLLIEESLLAMQRFCANPFTVLRPMQVTGVDRIDEQDRKISEKLAASIGHANGRKRILSETFALIGWKLAPPYMKRIIDHQFVRGVNWLAPHAFYYSIEGWRRQECPPSLFFQNPWWAHSKPLWDYVARLSAVLSQGTHIAPVALYYPIEQGWATVRPESPGPTQSVYPLPQVPFTGPDPSHPVEKTDAALNRLAFALTGGQYDFDLVDHDLVASARIIGKSLAIGGESFRAVVVPPMGVIDRRALEKMLAFAREGGLVLFAGELPRTTLDGDRLEDWDPLRRKLLEKKGPVSLGSGEIGFVPAGEQGILRLLNRRVPPDLRVIPTEITRRRVLTETQQSQFRHTRLPHLGEFLAYHRRRLDDEDIYFIVNESWHGFEATVELAGRAPVEQWEPHSGRRRLLPCQSNGEERVRITLGFEPWQSYLLVLAAGESPIPQRRRTLWTRPLDGWSLEVADVRHEGELLSWHELGLPTYSGAGLYRTRFDLDRPQAEGVRLELDLGMVLETARVRLNGVPLTPMAFPPYSADITEHVAPGINDLEIEVANTLVNALEQIERPSGLLGPVHLIATVLEPGGTP